MSQRKPHASSLKFFERILELPTGALFLAWILMVLGFATAYFELSSVHGGIHGVNTLSTESLWYRLGDAVYFSIITATTLGYGDITPLGFSRALAALESILGFFLLAAIISKLVSRKQEIALHNVHKLAFQDAFFKTREGFFILRRDCDAIEASVKDRHAFTEKSRSNFLIICQKGQTLFEGILDFYDESGLYTIDKRREQLLLDSVQRTLLRIHQLVRKLDAAKIRWRTPNDCVADLRDFASFAQTTLRRWQAASSHGNTSTFKKLSHAAKDLLADAR